MDNRLLLIGLGNPGSQYESNRHNVGFIIAEALVRTDVSLSFKKVAKTVEIAQASIGGTKIIVAKPQTFMNLSGQAARFLVDFYKIPVENVIVIHDDLDLEFARVKIKQGGGNGGHNGLRSIDSLIGNNYWRIRVGIGRPEMRSMITSYVLGDFEQQQREIIESIGQAVANNLSLIPSNMTLLAEKLNSL